MDLLGQGSKKPCVIWAPGSPTEKGALEDVCGHSQACSRSKYRMLFPMGQHVVVLTYYCLLIMLQAVINVQTVV